jgi:hypothetical protein
MIYLYEVRQRRHIGDLLYVIVLERLMVGFAGGAIFKSDPLIPPEFKPLWDFDVYVRGDGERTRSEGAIC